MPPPRVPLNAVVLEAEIVALLTVLP